MVDINKSLPHTFLGTVIITKTIAKKIGSPSVCCFLYLVALARISRGTVHFMGIMAFNPGSGY